MDDNTRALIQAQMQSKNVAMGLFLVLFFGGFGMFYVSIILGLFALVIEFVLIVTTFLTFGVGFIFVIIYHIVCTIVALVVMRLQNQALLNRL